MRIIILLSIFACNMGLLGMDNNNTIVPYTDLEAGSLEETKEELSFFKKAAGICTKASLFFSLATIGSSVYRHFKNTPTMHAIATGSVISAGTTLLAAYGCLGIDKCLLRSRKKTKLTLKEN